MAANLKKKASSLVIEIESETDKNGNPAFKKKTFSGIASDATADNIYDVANAIRDVLSCNVRAYELVVTNEVAEDVQE